MDPTQTPSRRPESGTTNKWPATPTGVHFNAAPGDDLRSVMATPGSRSVTLSASLLNSPALNRPTSDAGQSAPGSYAGASSTGPGRGPPRPGSSLSGRGSKPNSNVPPQSDFLANWESLATLVASEAQMDPAMSSPPLLPLQSPGPRSIPSSIPSSVMATPARSMLSRTAPQSPVHISRVEEEQDEAPASASASAFSGMLSSSPTDIDNAPALSFSQAVGDGVESEASSEVTTTPYRQGASTPAAPAPTDSARMASAEQAASTQGTKKLAFWPPPPYVVDILKCGIAYLIAELFTFVPQLSALLSTSSETDVHGRIRRRPAYSAHMVATIVVYFIPAKPIGNMILCTRYCFIQAAMSAMVCMLSFGIIYFFDQLSPSHGEKWDWYSETGDWMVCIVCVGGSMGVLAWLKVWMGSPSFNTSCSMAAVILFTVIVKEGGMAKLEEVLLIVLIGAIITNVVCFTVFPVSATSRLQKSISKSLQSFSTLLNLLSSTFLLEKTAMKQNRLSLAAAVKSHGAAFKSLKTDLAEAKHERILDPRIRGRRVELYDAALNSMARLAQHLAALRGSTRLQEDLIRASLDGRIRIDSTEKKRASMAESVVEDLNDNPDVGVEHEDVDDVAQTIALFLSLHQLLGPEMGRLVSECDEALDAIEDLAEPAPREHVDIPGIRTALASALANFSRASSHAIKRLYAGPRRRRGVYHSDSSDSDEEEEIDDNLTFEAKDGPNEVVFLAYFFLFTLEEFARELLFLLDTAYEIFEVPQLSAREQLAGLMAPWRKVKGRKKKYFLYKQFQRIVPIDPSKLQPPPFPRKKRDTPGTLLTPRREGMSLRGRISKWFWELGTRLREPDMQYALKTGIAGALLAAPAYAESTRHLFLEYRGEWALISFFVTMNPTLGQTNFVSFFRIFGTLLGGAVAVVACTLFKESPIIMPIFGFLFSLPCFYIITQTAYAQAGRFILLTYNLTALYSYNARDKELAPLDIAYRRAASVIIGVIWAAIVSRWWWPYTARRELRMGLGDFCLDLSYLYSKLVTTYTRGVEPSTPRASPVMTPPDYNTEGSDENSLLLPLSLTRQHHLAPDVLQFMSMELHLQSQLSYLRGLLSHAKNEPRLKGPFPFDFYHEVLLSCERMLDKLHSMRCVTTRQEWDDGMRETFVLPVNNLLREMAGNVILYFYTLSAGFRLRIPMPPYLPPAEVARERLVDAIRNLDVVKRRSVRGGGRHLLFFAYSIAMKEVITELDYIGGLLQDAFGVISQATVRDFEELFVGTQPADSYIDSYATGPEVPAGSGGLPDYTGLNTPRERLR